MLKLSVSLGPGKTFAIEGAVTVPEAIELLSRWYSELRTDGVATQAHIDSLVNKFSEMADGIDTVVQNLKGVGNNG